MRRTAAEDAARQEQGMSKAAKIWIGIGTVLIVAAAALTLYNIWDAARADRAAQKIGNALSREMDNGSKDRNSDDTGKLQMETITIDGRKYIGMLSIPAEDLELPVQYEWSYEALRISPCRYTGSYLTDDLVICAHNYAKHFSRIRWLAPGDDIYLRPVDGSQIHYTVENLETVQPTDIDDMIENQSDSGSHWDLTLFTCNIGGQTRCAVRCHREEE